MPEAPHSPGFNWGPPDSGRFERVKEWGVYVLLLLLLGLGTWFLVDSTSPDGQAITTETLFPVSARRLSTATSAVEVPVTVESPVVSGSQAETLKPVFLVQLGAFGEEQAALEAQTRLRKKGFAASLTIPNEDYEMFRLLLGPFAEEKQADDTARKLNELDFPCFVIESL